MKYRCLIFDHDDTTVAGSANIHYPAFETYCRQYRPDLNFSFEEYMKYNFDPGFFAFIKDICRFNEEETRQQHQLWCEYAASYVSEAYEGIKEVMLKEKEMGGIIVCISHSRAENILKDYCYNSLPEPDMVFGSEQPKEELKPSPIPLYRVMEHYRLKPEEIPVIDDLKPGLTMARAAGCDFAVAAWGI